MGMQLMKNPLFGRIRLQERQSKAYWRAPKQEKEIAKRFNGFQISGSGSKHRKGDVTVTGVARLETKTTKDASFSLSKTMLDKIKYAGLASGEIPAIIIEFLDKQGNPEMEVAVIPVDLLRLLIHDAQNKT
jgi:hypothetical protein